MVKNTIESIIKGMDGYNYPTIPTKVNIQIPNAENRLRGGLDYFVKLTKGEEFNAEWNEENYQPIVEWLEDNKGRGLLMTGSCGLGKSLIGYRIVPPLIKDVHRLVVNCYDSQEMNTKADEILGKRLVSIDDIGVEGVANIYGNKRLIFPELVDKAEKKGNLLIISTNLTINELRQKYGERTIDRLRCITKVVAFSGDSMRK